MPHAKRRVQRFSHHTGTLLFYPWGPKQQPQLVFQAAFIALMQHSAADNGTMHHCTKFPEGLMKGMRNNLSTLYPLMMLQIQVNIPISHASEVSYTSRRNETLATVTIQYTSNYTNRPLTQSIHGLLQTSIHVRQATSSSHFKNLSQPFPSITP